MARRIPSVWPSATATVTGSGRPAPARLSCASRSCARAPTSRASWSPAAWPRRRSPPWCEGDPQRFKLAHGVMKLSHVWLKGLEVVAVARPILEELRDATGETAALFRLEEDRGICILECESRHVLSISRGVGDSLKIAQGATGKAMLAFMPAERQAAFLAHLPRDGQRIHLEEALRTAVHHAHTICPGGIFVGALAVAAPCFDHRGNVIGSVGLFGPSARVSEERVSEFARLVRQAGHKISTLLGFQEPEGVPAETHTPDPELDQPRKRLRKLAKV